jgi:hypothetical protein
MDKILERDTFNRFELIKDMIQKYPVIKDTNLLNEINKIKDSYIEYTPKYDTISDYEKVNEYAQLLIHRKSWQNKINELNDMKHYVSIIDGNLEIVILYKDSLSIPLVNLIFSVIKLFKKINGDKKILAIIGLCKMKRKITGNIIGRENVNGGGDDVFGLKIYREEEVLKVILHELTHYYKLDNKELDENQVEILKKFKIIHPEGFGEEANKSIHEAYTEITAMKYYIALISYYTKNSPLIIYHYEKIWSLYQVCKILSHYMMVRFEDLYTKDLVEDTHVFAYYIIKFFFLWNNTKDFRMIGDVLEDKEIIRIINENINRKFDNSLRMTFFELKK